jgi:hypothetical protein
MGEKRRFRRIECLENCSVSGQKGLFSVKLLDISLKGALIEFEGEVPLEDGEAASVCLQLSNSDVKLTFETQVVHHHGRLAGVKFMEMDLDTMIHLRGLMEARTMDPELLHKEIAFFVEED